MLRFPQPHKCQLDFNTLKSCSSARELHRAVFQPSGPNIAALPPAPRTGARTGGRSPLQQPPSACDRKILSGGSFTSPTAFCWQVVLPGNLQWGEQGNTQASGTSNAPNWGVGPPKPPQHSSTAAACPAPSMRPCRCLCCTFLPHHGHGPHDSKGFCCPLHGLGLLDLLAKAFRQDIPLPQFLMCPWGHPSGWRSPWLQITPS